MKTTPYPFALYIVLLFVGGACSQKASVVQNPPLPKATAKQYFQNSDAVYSDWFRFVAGDWRDTVLPSGKAKYAIKELPQELINQSGTALAQPLLYTRFTANDKALRLPLEYVSGADAQSLKLQALAAKNGILFLVTDEAQPQSVPAGYGGELRVIVSRKNSVTAGLKYREAMATLGIPAGGTNL